VWVHAGPPFSPPHRVEPGAFESGRLPLPGVAPPQIPALEACKFRPKSQQFARFQKDFHLHSAEYSWRKNPAGRKTGPPAPARIVANRGKKKRREWMRQRTRGPAPRKIDMAKSARRPARGLPARHAHGSCEGRSVLHRAAHGKTRTGSAP